MTDRRKRERLPPIKLKKLQRADLRDRIAIYISQGHGDRIIAETLGCTRQYVNLRRNILRQTVKATEKERA